MDDSESTIGLLENKIDETENEPEMQMNRNLS